MQSLLLWCTEPAEFCQGQWQTQDVSVASWEPHGDCEGQHCCGDWWRPKQPHRLLKGTLERVCIPCMLLLAGEHPHHGVRTSSSILSDATHPLLSPPRSPRQVKVRWSKGLVFPHCVSSSLIFQINIPFSDCTLKRYGSDKGKIEKDREAEGFLAHRVSHCCSTGHSSETTESWPCWVLVADVTQGLSHNVVSCCFSLSCHKPFQSYSLDAVMSLTGSCICSPCIHQVPLPKRHGCTCQAWWLWLGLPFL